MKSLIAVLALMCSTFAFATTDYSCMGTEPFFNLNIEGSKMSISSPIGDGAKSEEVISRISAAGYSEDVAFVVKTATATATIIAGACSDGMSDEIYSNHVVYTTEESVLYGCCNKIEK